jgi:hypothetical protein
VECGMCERKMFGNTHVMIYIYIYIYSVDALVL